MTSRDRIAEPWGTRTPYARGQAWPVRVDSYLADQLDPAEVDRWVQSAAVLHSNGDGLDIAVKDGRIVGLRGRQVDRVNHGRVDPKDLFGWQANNSADRLTRPLIRRGDTLTETDWDTAMDAIVANQRRRTLANAAPTATCPVFATGRTTPMWPTWPGCGTSTWRRSRTTSSQPTRCRYSGSPSREPFGCCGSSPPIRRCRCRNCGGFAAS